ncbi:MAG: alkylation response protein AidB-like acyl-CoA dehydrogenase [Planctomycetota bacterium]|jgi:alkylation response protein AidB-like acyl-CoA dehydrogenase
MEFQLSDELKALRVEAREVAREFIAPTAMQRDRDKAFPHELLKICSEKGWMGCLVSKEFGGSDMGNLGQAIVLEEVAVACVSTHVTVSVHNSLMSTPMKKYASPKLQEAYLPQVASGAWLGAYLLTEPGAGSDAASLKTTAVEDGDEFVINGDKMWITSGDEARLGIVFARTEQDPEIRGPKAISAFVVDFEKTDGVTYGKREPKLGIRGSSTVAVFLKNVRVPKENLLGERGRGFNIAMDLLNGGRIGIAIQAIGVARASFELALREVTKLERGGMPLAKSQVVQFRLADMATRIDAARLLALRAAVMRDNKEQHIKEASMAKYFASKVANEICREVCELLGEAGIHDNSEAERFLRDCRVTELYEGTTEVQKLVIAKQLFSELES